MAQELLSNDVDDLVDNGITPETTEELFSFGKLLFANNDDRVKTIEIKSSSIIGYSSAILAFLLTRSADVDKSPLNAVCFVIIGCCAIAACIYGWFALKSRPWKALSETTWFPLKHSSKPLEPNDLRRWYVKAMHQMYQENHRITDKKARWMVRAQHSVELAGIALGIALVGNSVRYLAHFFF
jgi:hypothetical protein